VRRWLRRRRPARREVVTARLSDCELAELIEGLWREAGRVPSIEVSRALVALTLHLGRVQADRARDYAQELFDELEDVLGGDGR
jgi:hypothetical protein